MFRKAAEAVGATWLACDACPYSNANTALSMVACQHSRRHEWACHLLNLHCKSGQTVYVTPYVFCWSRGVPDAHPPDKRDSSKLKRLNNSQTLYELNSDNTGCNQQTLSPDDSSGAATWHNLTRQTACLHGRLWHRLRLGPIATYSIADGVCRSSQHRIQSTLSGQLSGMCRSTVNPHTTHYCIFMYLCIYVYRL